LKNSPKKDFQQWEKGKKKKKKNKRRPLRNISKPTRCLHGKKQHRNVQSTKATQQRWKAATFREKKHGGPLWGVGAKNFKEKREKNEGRKHPKGDGNAQKPEKGRMKDKLAWEKAEERKKKNAVQG